MRGGCEMMFWFHPVITLEVWLMAFNGQAGRCQDMGVLVKSGWCTTCTWMEFVSTNFREAKLLSLQLESHCMLKTFGGEVPCWKKLEKGKG